MQRSEVQVAVSPKETSSRDTSCAPLVFAEHSLKLDEQSTPQEEPSCLHILSPKPMRPLSLANWGDQFTKEKGNKFAEF